MGYLQKKIKAVQSIVGFFEDPCHAPWTVYVELALPAAGHLVIELLSFGMDDIIRGYFRPAGIYRRSRTGRRRRRFGKYATIPELGEMIGAHLPGAETLRGRRVTNGVRFMWIVDGVLQRILFWWMIVDLLTDFLYEWTSAVAQTEFCKRGKLTGAMACDVQPNTIPPASLAPDGVTLNCSFLHKAWGSFDPAGGFVTNAPFTFFAAQCTMIPLAITSPGALHLWIAPAASPGMRMPGADTAEFNEVLQKADALANAKTMEGGTYIVRANCDGPGFGFISEGLLQGYGYLEE